MSLCAELLSLGTLHGEHLAMCNDDAVAQSSSWCLLHEFKKQAYTWMGSNIVTLRQRMLACYPDVWLSYFGTVSFQQIFASGANAAANAADVLCPSSKTAVVVFGPESMSSGWVYFLFFMPPGGSTFGCSNLEFLNRSRDNSCHSCLFDTCPYTRSPFARPLQTLRNISGGRREFHATWNSLALQTLVTLESKARTVEDE